jgi:glutamate racemase
VVEPGAMAAVEASRSDRIMVLATETTIASLAYHRAIRAIRPQAFVDGRACSLLVALAEEGMVNHAVTDLTLQHYLEKMVDVDTVLLGCTHFPVFTKALKRILPEVTVVDSAAATAKVLSSQLAELNLLRAGHLGGVRYLVTDAVDRFCRIGQLFLGEDLRRLDVNLIDV